MIQGAGVSRLGAAEAPGQETGEPRRILESDTLRRADRLKELLAYLLNRAGAAPEAPIREQEIGAAVYHRDANYDTSHDTIVRVQMAQLRKKLERYYETEGAADPFILTIPRGGYHPIWQRKAPETPIAAQELPKSSPKIAVTRRRLAAACALVCILATAIALWRAGGAPHRGMQKLPPCVARLWSQLLTPAKTTHIVLSDPGLVMLANTTGRPVRFPELGDRLFFNRLQAWEASPEFKAFVQSFSGAQLTTLSDVEIVRVVTALGLLGPDMIRVVAARDFRIRDFDGNNVILVGFGPSNPWVEVFAQSLNFILENDRGAGIAQVRNRNPLNGEQPLYRLENAGVVNPAQGYVTVALLPNPTVSGKVLIVSGADVPGTEAAIGFLTNEAQWEPFVQRIARDGEIPGFEALLSYRRLSNSSGDVTPLAWRVHAVRNR